MHTCSFCAIFVAHTTVIALISAVAVQCAWRVRAIAEWDVLMLSVAFCLSTKDL